MINGFVTQAADPQLLVQPRGGKSGIPVSRVADSADTGTWAVGDEVLCEVIGGLLYVVDRVT